MASGQEISQYCKDVKQKFGLDAYIQFNTTLEQAEWDEEAGKWKLRSKSCDLQRARLLLVLILGASGAER